MNPAAADKTTELLATLWTRNLPIVRERLDLLDGATQRARDAALDTSLRREAAVTAHKLAGSLGMYGYSEGTAIARQLELLFDNPTPPDPARLSSLTAGLRRSLNL